MPDATPLAATVEDYDSGTDEAIGTSPTQTQSRPAPQRAPPPCKVALDAASDSGYSSRTAATLGSADSAEIPSKPPFAPERAPVPISPTTNPTRTSLGGTKKHLSPELRPTSRPVSRPNSRTTARRIPDEQFKRCPDPNCKDCTMARRPSPLESPWNLQYPHVAPNPAQPRYPSPAPHWYSQSTAAYQYSDVPLVPTPQPRRRPGTARPRPQSYHPGVMPDGYWVPVASTAHGPPPAPSAYNTPFFNPTDSAYSYPHMHPAPSPTMYRAPPPPPFGQQPPSTAPLLHARPAFQQRSTDTYISRPRPSSLYEMPPPASFAPNGYSTALVRRNSSSARRSRNSPPHESYYVPDVDRQRMPPPPRPNDATLRRNSSQRRKESTSRRYDTDRYQRSDGSDSSGSGPDAAIRTHTPHSGHSAIPSSYEQTKNEARDYINNTQGRRRSYASHEQRRNSDRRGSTEADAYYSDQSRYVRTTARPARVNEDSIGDATAEREARRQSASRSESQTRTSNSRDGSSVSKGGVEGFKIEVDKQGMNLNVLGQRISVMPKEGGFAELVFQKETPYPEDGRSQSSGSRHRAGRSSMSSSDVALALGTNSRPSSRPTRRATVAATEK